MSGEARREAERRWPLWLPTGDYETDQENYNEQSAKWQNAESEEHQRAFVRGTQWQAARDAARIAELKAEVERLRGLLDATDRQIEARTGETAGERLWKARAEQADSERDAAIELMQEAESDTERAEALLARTRELVTERIDGYPDDPYDFVREFALGVLAILDGDNNE